MNTIMRAATALFDQLRPRKEDKVALAGGAVGGLLLAALDYPTALIAILIAGWGQAPHLSAG